MTDHYLTEEGKKRLSELLKEAMEREGVSSLRGLGELITQRSGLEVRFNRLQRLMKGHYDDASVTLIFPIVKAKILKLPNGDPYTFDDIVAVLVGELDPKTGRQRKEGIGNENGSDG